MHGWTIQSAQQPQSDGSPQKREMYAVRALREDVSVDAVFARVRVGPLGVWRLDLGNVQVRDAADDDATWQEHLARRRSPAFRVRRLAELESVLRLEPETLRQRMAERVAEVLSKTQPRSSSD
jgi:hypothetical protein